MEISFTWTTTFSTQKKILYTYIVYQYQKMPFNRWKQNAGKTVYVLITLYIRNQDTYIWYETVKKSIYEIWAENDKNQL